MLCTCPSGRLDQGDVGEQVRSGGGEDDGEHDRPPRLRVEQLPPQSQKDRAAFALRVEDRIAEVGSFAADGNQVPCRIRIMHIDFLDNQWYIPCVHLSISTYLCILNVCKHKQKTNKLTQIYKRIPAPFPV